MKLFLDDVRQPHVCLSYMHRRIGAKNLLYSEDWTVVRNYDEFVVVLSKNYNEITHISFDHDLADIHYDPSTWNDSFVYAEKTGYDCAVFAVSLYKSLNLPLPECYVHSMNPVGTTKILELLSKYETL